MTDVPMLMLAREQAAYWDRGAANVPDMTGAKNLMDCADLRALSAALGFALPFREAVLDVGCGTGRAASACAGIYVGTDVASGMVAYCVAAGLDAHVVLEPWRLARLGSFGTVLCLSVFTHIPRRQRLAYLWSFRRLAPRLLVDILPGPGPDDEIPMAYADPDAFVADLAACGFEVLGTHEAAWDGLHAHRYHWCGRAS